MAWRLWVPSCTALLCVCAPVVCVTGDAAAAYARAWVAAGGVDRAHARVIFALVDNATHFALALVQWGAARIDTTPSRLTTLIEVCVCVCGGGGKGDLL